MKSSAIETPRLILRDLHDSDAEALFFHYRERPENEYMLFGPFRTVDDAKTTVSWACTMQEDGKGFVRAVEDRESGDLIGVVDFVHQSWSNGAAFRTEISYDVSPEYWGQGLATEAVKALVYHVFNSYTEIIRVEAVVDTRNYRSVRVLLKSGFNLEGILRSYGCRRGVFYDAAMWAMLRSGWEADS